MSVAWPCASIGLPSEPPRTRARPQNALHVASHALPYLSPPPSSPSHRRTRPSSTVAMFARSAARSLLSQSRQFSSSAARQSKVAVLGAGGGIGQPLSLLLKLNPLVTSLSIYDVRGAPGVAADVSHVDTHSEVSSSALLATCKLMPTFPQVKGYPADQLDQALEGTDVVVIPAGVPRKVCTFLISLRVCSCTDCVLPTPSLVYVLLLGAPFSFRAGHRPVLTPSPSDDP